MKNDRQSMILEIISQENIETQEQLLSRLQERGITSTQATISRDIKQMHLIKEPVGHGVYKYAVSGNRTRLNFAEKLRTIFRESITSIDSAQNIVVIMVERLSDAHSLYVEKFSDAGFRHLSLRKENFLCVQSSRLFCGRHHFSHSHSRAFRRVSKYHYV